MVPRTRYPKYRAPGGTKNHFGIMLSMFSIIYAIFQMLLDGNPQIHHKTIRMELPAHFTQIRIVRKPSVLVDGWGLVATQSIQLRYPHIAIAQVIDEDVEEVG